VYDLARPPVTAALLAALMLGSLLFIQPIAAPAPSAHDATGLAPPTFGGTTVRTSPSTPAPAPTGSSALRDTSRELAARAVHPSGATFVPVFFDQEGLVLGTEWSIVVIDVGTLYSNGTSATLSLTPGEYSWAAGPVQGYRTSAGGSFQVTDAAIWIPVAYHGVLFTTYPVTFRSPEIPPGAVWYVNLQGGAVASSANSTLTFYVANGSIGWYIGPTVHLTASPAGGVLQVNGTPVEQTILWLLDPGYFEVLFNETGLPAGFNWSVTLNGSTTHAFDAPLGFIVPNGSYPFSDEAPSGFVGTPPGGTALVAGSDTEFLIVFGPKPIPTFAITFLGENVPSRGTWSVTLAGLTLIANGPGVGMEFLVPNGTYFFQVRAPFGFMSTPPNGTVTVDGSDPATIGLLFAHAPVPGYEVTFLESGLPPGTAWDVDWGDGAYYVSTNRTITLTSINGTYLWWVSSSSTETPSPSNGEVNLSGPLPGPLLIRFSFPPTRFPVRFVEDGLPNGTLWSISIVGGATYPSNSPTIEVDEPNGSFSFYVGNISGMNSTPWRGTFDVKGGPLEVDVSWHVATAPFLGSADFWLLVTLSSATAIAAFSLVWHYRRPRLPFTRRTARRLYREEFRH